jgi:hypothetical protein
VSFDNGSIFFLAPPLLADFRVEMVVPPLATLLADSAWEMLGYEAPVLGPMLAD